MSTSERELKLMAYVDGELEGAELDEVEAWLAEDARAARLVHQLANLGDLVKAGHHHSADAKAVAAFDIADAVMAKIATEGSVASLAAGRARKQANLKRAGAVVAAALALAASVFLMSRNKEERPMARVPANAVQPSANNEPGVDVDLAETPGHSVSVFYLPSESTTTTSVVVWIDETGGK